MSLIQFENVNYIYGVGTTFEKQALKNICFTVESGSFIGLIGHTGSGKSTLIQHMNGLIRPTSGKIYFHDEDITADGYKKKEFVRRSVLFFSIRNISYLRLMYWRMWLLARRIWDSLRKRQKSGRLRHFSWWALNKSNIHYRPLNYQAVRNAVWLLQVFWPCSRKC